MSQQTFKDFFSTRLANQKISMLPSSNFFNKTSGNFKKNKKMLEKFFLTQAVSKTLSKSSKNSKSGRNKSKEELPKIRSVSTFNSSKILNVETQNGSRKRVQIKNNSRAIERGHQSGSQSPLPVNN